MFVVDLGFGRGVDGRGQFAVGLGFLHLSGCPPVQRLQGCQHHRRHHERENQDEDVADDHADTSEAIIGRPFSTSEPETRIGRPVIR